MSEVVVVWVVVIELVASAVFKVGRVNGVRVGMYIGHSQNTPSSHIGHGGGLGEQFTLCAYRTTKQMEIVNQIGSIWEEIEIYVLTSTARVAKDRAVRSNFIVLS